MKISGPVPTRVYGGTMNLAGLYNSENSFIPDNRIHDLAFDNLNKMWLDTPIGLIQYDTVNVKIFNTENSILPQNVFSAFMVDKCNAVWMGTYGDGLVEYYQDNWNIYDLSNSGLPNNDVKCIDFDSKGQIWIALAGGNLVKFDGYDWTLFNSSVPGLSSSLYFTCMDFDDQDHLWLATWGHGVIEFDPENTKVTVYDSSNSPLPSNSVNALVIDLNNTKWISFLNEDLNYHGLAKFYGENWTIFDAWNAPFTANRIRSMAVDRFNNKWFGTYGDYYGEAKLIKYADTKWTVYTPPHTNATTFSTIYDIVVDRSDKIWFGTREYLTCFDGTEWLDYPRQDIMSLAIDKEDNIWLGTLNGVVKFNRSDWEEFTAVNSLLPSDQISTIIFDDKNNLWISTVTNGIAVYQKNGVINVIKELPQTNYLYQNYPNPFNLSTSIRFYITETGKVSLRIYDVPGRKIKTILDQELVPDMYIIDFNARDLASGIYYYQLQSSNYTETKKMILLR
jgi:ligand-binding sensor domain-containing protein